MSIRSEATGKTNLASAGVVPVRSSGAKLRRMASAYLRLTKPRIVLLLLVTTVPAMILAEGGVPALWLIAATLLGGTIAAGGANAINQYLDRDIDEIMSRTRTRPLPSHAIEPSHALRFGIALSVVSFVFLTIAVNLLAAVLAVGAIGFYVGVYTIWLKRRSPQNIVIGGAAGAVPVLVGWAAVTGTVGWPAVVLFAIVFMWTPPHFWALSLRFQRDYAAAGVPMLPVVAGWDRTVRDILVYAVLLTATTFVLVPVAGMGLLYGSAAAALGALFVGRAFQLLRRPDQALAMSVFRLSIAYLALLFLAVALDTVVRLGL